ncbi:MAG: dehydratase [Chloroflexi bacterium]|nr:dehydratase [Chloroflexota bacterium]
MGKQVYYEDVDVGSEVSSLVKHPTTQQLVKYAGASGDYYQIHYDKDYALSNDLPGVIVHGALKNAFLGQLLTDWIGEEGTLRHLSVQYRSMDVPGDTLTCKGRVTGKEEKDGEHLVHCDIWLENGKGEKTTPGTATVALPSRCRAS